MIKGITWDHPRGYQPLKAAAARWLEIAGVEIKWDVRTLKEFGDLPIEKLVSIYDLIIIDHPYMGEAAWNGLLVPLIIHFSTKFLETQSSQSVGPSFESYQYNQSLYALPVDAAAQVAAYRKDLIERAGWKLPTETSSLKDAAYTLEKGYQIAVPLCPTDIWCVFLSLCAQYSNGDFFSATGVSEEVGKWALEEISDWKSFVHKNSFTMNPVQMLEQMGTEDAIVYSPFVFGYTNYSRPHFVPKRIHFGNVPQYGLNKVTALLGGAGIAISGETKNLNSCLDFIQFVLDPETQKNLYYKEGGQPAHLAAWKDEKCNADSGNFFSNTLHTLQNAYVRPRVPGFNRFQEKAADLIHTAALKSTNASLAITQLNNLYNKLCHGKL